MGLIINKKMLKQNNHLTKRSKYILLFIVVSLFSFSQERTLTGIVSDSLNKPLERANVIAKPLQDNAGLKFAIANYKINFNIKH